MQTAMDNDSGNERSRSMDRQGLESQVVQTGRLLAKISDLKKARVDITPRVTVH